MIGMELVAIGTVESPLEDRDAARGQGDEGRARRVAARTRSPDCPNPIGLHRVAVLAVDGGRLHVSDVEAVDGTLKPLLRAIEER
jgi:tRNA (Thr-GGU) A37 N-methylase